MKKKNVLQRREKTRALLPRDVCRREDYLDTVGLFERLLPGHS